MLSRRTSRLVAELYGLEFCTRRVAQRVSGVLRPPPVADSTADEPALRDFLYDRGHDAWTLQVLPYFGRALVVDRIKQLHTGEVVNRQDWTWEERSRFGQQLGLRLAGDIVHHCWGDGPLDMASLIPDHLGKPFADVVAGFTHDGYAYRSGQLIAREGSAIGVAEAEGLIERLVSQAALPTAKLILVHLAKSEEHFVRKDYGDAIAQARNLCESILRGIAARCPLGEPPVSPEATLDQLRKHATEVQILDEKESKALAAVQSMMAHKGSHSYMAEHEHARLLRDLALTFAQLLLSRFVARQDQPV